MPVSVDGEGMPRRVAKRFEQVWRERVSFWSLLGEYPAVIFDYQDTILPFQDYVQNVVDEVQKYMGAEMIFVSK